MGRDSPINGHQKAAQLRPASISEPRQVKKWLGYRAITPCRLHPVRFHTALCDILSGREVRSRAITPYQCWSQAVESRYTAVETVGRSRPRQPGLSHP